MENKISFKCPNCGTIREFSKGVRENVWTCITEDWIDIRCANCKKSIHKEKLSTSSL